MADGPPGATCRRSATPRTGTETGRPPSGSPARVGVSPVSPPPAARSPGHPESVYVARSLDVLGMWQYSGKHCDVPGCNLP